MPPTGGINLCAWNSLGSSMGSSLSSSAGERLVYVEPVNPLSQIEPLAVHRNGFVHSTFLLVLSAIAQLLLLLLFLQPLPALAADPCPPGMAPIPGGSYRIGAGAQLPEEQPGRSLRNSRVAACGSAPFV